MTEEQAQLISQAKESLEAARILNSSGYHGFAASRAYYSMFYIAEAFLLGKQMTFSSHTAVISAFGRELAKTGSYRQSFTVSSSEAWRCATPVIMTVARV